MLVFSQYVVKYIAVEAGKRGIILVITCTLGLGVIINSAVHFPCIF